MRSPIKSRISRNPAIPVSPAMRASRPMVASPAMAPMGGSPAMAPTGMKKGGKVKSGAAKSGPQSIVGKSTPRGTSAKSGPQNIKGKSIPKKKGGLAIMIAVGKPKKGK